MVGIEQIIVPCAPTSHELETTVAFICKKFSKQSTHGYPKYLPTVMNSLRNKRWAWSNCSHVVVCPSFTKRLVFNFFKKKKLFKAEASLQGQNKNGEYIL